MDETVSGQYRDNTGTKCDSAGRVRGLYLDFDVTVGGMCRNSAWTVWEICPDSVKIVLGICRDIVKTMRGQGGDSPRTVLRHCIYSVQT